MIHGVKYKEYILIKKIFIFFLCILYIIMYNYQSLLLFQYFEI